MDEIKFSIAAIAGLSKETRLTYRQRQEIKNIREDMEQLEKDIQKEIDNGKEKICPA